MDLNKIKSLDCCKGLLHSLIINVIKHFFVQSRSFNSKLFEKMPGLLMYVVTVLTLPHTMPVLNAER